MGESRNQLGGGDRFGAGGMGGGMPSHLGPRGQAVWANRHGGPSMGREPFMQGGGHFRPHPGMGGQMPLNGNPQAPHGDPRMSGPTPTNPQMPGAPQFGGFPPGMAPFEQGNMMYGAQPPRGYSTFANQQTDPQRKQFLDQWAMRNPNYSHGG